MTNCKECKTEISSKAAQCPKCGVPIKRTSLVAKLALIMVVLFVISAIMSSNEKQEADQRQAQAEASRIAQLSPEQRAAEQAAKKEAEDLDTARYMCKEFSKKALHDPASAEFEPYKTFFAERDKKTGIFRAQAHMTAINGFGAKRKTVIECGMTHKENGDWVALTVRELNL